jgi:hypothetical protein
VVVSSEAIVGGNEKRVRADYAVIVLKNAEEK